MNDFNDSHVPAQPDNLPLKGLTPKEEAAAKQRAREGYEAMVNAEFYDDEIDINELAQTPERIRKFLMFLLVSAPFIVVLVGIAGIILTGHKEYMVFAVWGWVVGLAAVVVITGGLILEGFTTRLNRLRSGSDARKVTTMAGLVRAVAVRIGFVPTFRWQKGLRFTGFIKPLSHDQMEENKVGMLYFIAVAVNIYGYIMPTLKEWEAAGDAFTLSYSQGASLVLGVILGATMPRILEVTGAQLAEYGYQFFLETKRRIEREARLAARHEFEARWAVEKELVERRELHRSLLAKNGLSITANVDSPYLLIDGEKKEVGQQTAAPLANSQRPSPGHSKPVLVISQNGNGTH